MTTESSFMETEHLETNIVVAAATDLDAERAASQMNRADVVSRAIQLYHYFMEEDRNGHEIFVRDKKTGDVKRVEIETASEGQR
jgi:hypothetical protein